MRNALLLRALRREFDVIEVTDNRPGSLLARNLRLAARLLHARTESHDLAFVGFYGHLLTLLLTRLTRKPLIFDAFMSTWDTLCFDRKQFSSRSLPGRLAFQIDQQACQRATHCLLDTAAHKQYFSSAFGLPEDKMTPYYLGYDDEVFFPRPPAVASSDAFTVSFYSSYLPLHGVEYIVHAAKLLENEPGIRFQIIGEGMVYPQVRQLADDLQVRHLTFEPAVPYATLANEITTASVCLGGPFGSTNKAQRVIGGKTYQFMAMAKPTIVGDSPANREILTNRENALFCPMASGEALADAIIELKRDRDLREHLAQNGCEYCRREFNIEKQAARLSKIVRNLL